MSHPTVHVLHFGVGAERYAVPSARVTEVLPRVPLRPVPGTLPGVAGLLSYRGQVIPVVDLCALFGHGPAPARLSTRIAVVDPEGASRPYGSEAEAGRPRRLLGLLAERMLEAGPLDPEAPGSHAGPVAPALPALGRVTRDARGLVQLVEVRDLLPEAVWASLERPEAAADGSTDGAR